MTKILLGLYKCLLDNVGTNTTTQTLYLNKMTNHLKEQETLVIQLQQQYKEFMVNEFTKTKKVDFDNLGPTYGVYFDKLFCIIKNASFSNAVRGHKING